MKKSLFLLLTCCLFISSTYALMATTVQPETVVKPECPTGTITREITHTHCKTVQVPYYVHSEVCHTKRVRVPVYTTSCRRRYYGRRYVWRRVCVPGIGCYRTRVARRGPGLRCVPVVTYRYAPGKRVCTLHKVKKYRDKKVCDTSTEVKCIKKETTHETTDANKVS